MQNIFLKDKGILQLCKALGVPDDLITAETTHIHIPNCFIIACTYGEIQMAHPPLKDQRMKEWFGEQEFGEGRFTRELAPLRDGKRQVNGVNLPAILDSLADLLAESIVARQGPFAFDPPSLFPPAAFIEGSDVVFGGNHGQNRYREHLLLPIRSVLALDPGVPALNHIDQLVQLCVPKAKQDPLFQYVTINPFFLADLLTTYFNLRCQQISKDRRLEKLLRERDVFSPIEGDLATATQKMIALRQRRKEPIDCFDVVLYTSYRPPRVPLTDAQQVIKNAYDLLHPGGAFLLGFPMTGNAEGHASGSDLARLALQCGFIPHTARSYVTIGDSRFPAYTFFIKSGAVKSELAFTLGLPQSIYQEMVTHVMNAYPQMACGMLGCANGRVIKHYPVTNAAPNPKVWALVSDGDLVHIVSDVDNYDGDLAFYMSEPMRDASPSQETITYAQSSGYPYVIFSLKQYPEPPSCRVFTVNSVGSVTEGKLELV